MNFLVELPSLKTALPAKSKCSAPLKARLYNKNGCLAALKRLKPPQNTLKATEQAARKPTEQAACKATEQSDDKRRPQTHR